MSRYIDADALLKYIDERAKIYGITTSNKLNFMAFVEKAPTVNLTPCDVCAYNPPSSGDGTPCSMCPAVTISGGDGKVQGGNVGMTVLEYETKIIALKEANAILGNAIKARDAEIEELKEELERRKRHDSEQENAEN